MSEFEAILTSLETRGWAVADGCLPEAIITQLREAGAQAWREGLFHPAHVGSPMQPVRDAVIRGDSIHWLDSGHPAPGCQAFLAWTQALQQSLNQAFYLGLRRAEFHFARYGAGQGYQRHMDQHRGQPHRKISLVLYLNRIWGDADGGELCLYAPDDPETLIETVQPRFGRMVIFRSDLIPHAVQPCARQRWSLTGWFRNDATLTGQGPEKSGAT